MFLEKGCFRGGKLTFMGKECSRGKIDVYGYGMFRGKVDVSEKRDILGREITFLGCSMKKMDPPPKRQDFLPFFFRKRIGLFLSL